MRDFVARGRRSMVIVTDRGPILKQGPLMVCKTLVQVPLGSLDIPQGMEESSGT
jgi:hypothetical protein